MSNLNNNNNNQDISSSSSTPLTEELATAIANAVNAALAARGDLALPATSFAAPLVGSGLVVGGDGLSASGYVRVASGPPPVVGSGFGSAGLGSSGSGFGSGGVHSGSVEPKEPPVVPSSGMNLNEFSSVTVSDFLSVLF